MSYTSQNTLPKGTPKDAIFEFLEILGYERFKGRYPLRQQNIFDFGWYSESDYESSTGVELSVGTSASGAPFVYTRTPAARSYHDLVHQNRTIKQIQRRFGGYFTTDSGRNRCWSTRGMAILPPAGRGVLRANGRFRKSLMQTMIYRSSISVRPEFRKLSGIQWMDDLNPMILVNNLLLPFLTAALEDFFKSSFVALLRYSERKELFFKGSRLNSAQLTRVSNKTLTIEEAVAESLPFQRIASVCAHFKALDPALDFAGCLKRPYRKRRESLYTSLEAMVEKRHSLIHQNTLTLNYSDSHATADIHNLEVSVERCLKRMNAHYAWGFSSLELHG